MTLSDYPAESLSFSSVAATGDSPESTGATLASALDAWAAAHPGRRILQLTPVAAAGGLVALIVHTAGPDLSGELAEQVAAAVGEALEFAESGPAPTDVRCRWQHDERA